MNISSTQHRNNRIRKQKAKKRVRRERASIVDTLHDAIAARNILAAMKQMQQ